MVPFRVTLGDPNVSGVVKSTSVNGQRDKLVTVIGHQFITLTVNICRTVGVGHASQGSVSGSGYLELLKALKDHFNAYRFGDMKVDS